MPISSSSMIYLVESGLSKALTTITSMSWLGRTKYHFFGRIERLSHIYQRADILSLGAAGMRKYQIMKHFLRRCGYGGVGFVRQDLYNLCCREKRKLIAKADAATALCIMAARKKNDPEFFFDYDVDDKGHLKCMF
jgi:hypothetical protein